MNSMGVKNQWAIVTLNGSNGVFARKKCANRGGCILEDSAILWYHIIYFIRTTDACIERGGYERWL